MMKILLTNPTLENERDVTDPLLPLGMISIAAYLRKHLDESLDFKYVNHKFPEGFTKYKPDIVFMTTMSPYYHKAVKVARQYKELDSSVPIITGGYHVSILPKTMTENMDVGVIGEGELTSLELFKNELIPSKSIKGLVYRDNGTIITTEPRPFIKNLDILPFPARDIMKHLIHPQQFTGMMSARGCPYHCVFCANSAFWGGIRFFSAEYVINEIEHLAENYTKRLNFLDDAFTVNKPRLRKIVAGLEERGIEIEVYANGRADMIDDEMCELVKRIGIKDLCFGLESGNQKTLNYLKEGRITTEMNHRALDLCNKHGIHVTASTVIGSPDETKEEIYDTYKLLNDPRVNYGVANILVPLPGTPVWKEALERGLVEESADWDWGRLTFAFPYYSFEGFHDLVVMSKHLNIEELYEVWLDFKKVTQRKTIKYRLRDGIRRPYKTLRFLWSKIRWKLLSGK